MKLQELSIFLRKLNQKEATVFCQIEQSEIRGISLKEIAQNLNLSLIQTGLVIKSLLSKYKSFCEERGIVHIHISMDNSSNFFWERKYTNICLRPLYTSIFINGENLGHGYYLPPKPSLNKKKYFEFDNGIFSGDNTGAIIEIDENI